MFNNAQTITFIAMNKNIIFSIISLLFLAFAYYVEAILPQRESLISKALIQATYEQNKTTPIEINGGSIDYFAIIPENTMQFVITFEEKVDLVDFEKYIKKELVPQNMPNFLTPNAFTPELLSTLIKYDIKIQFTIKNKSGKVISEIKLTKDDYKK